MTSGATITVSLTIVMTASEAKALYELVEKALSYEKKEDTANVASYIREALLDVGVPQL